MLLNLLWGGLFLKLYFGENFLLLASFCLVFHVTSLIPSDYELFREFSFSKVNNPLVIFMLFHSIVSSEADKVCFHLADFFCMDIFSVES